MTRVTHQRIKIIEYLKKTRTHPTAEMVYKGVAKDLPTISLATVYRNLNMLAGEGKVLKLEINGEYHFDGITESHQHLICMNCGTVIDLEQEEISNYAMKKIKSDKFQAKYVSVIFHGMCKHC
jgi:Fur family transcriptional regulator, peroxide stress response regulator